MPFFPKLCFRLRKKKKKAIKKNSSTYFKSFYDKESPVTSEVIHEGASTSFASIDRDGRDIGLLTRLVLGRPESQTQNTEARESGETENITGVPSPDRDILNILNSSAEQMSEENGSSDDNRYGILNSSYRSNEETDNIELTGLINEAFEPSDDQLSIFTENNQLSDSFVKECVADCESKVYDFIIASKLNKSEFLADFSNAQHENTAEVTAIMPFKKCSASVIAFVSTHNKINEVEPLMPVTVMDCFNEQTVPPVSVNEYAELSDYTCNEKLKVEREDVSISDTSSIYLRLSTEQNDSESESALNNQEKISTVNISEYQEEINEPTMNQFPYTEPSLVVQKASSTNLCEGDVENALQRISGLALMETFETDHLEITSASNQQNIGGTINPFKRINLSFGDNSPELLKRDCNTAENIISNDRVFKEAFNTSEMIDELRSPILSECCGDHSANITDTYSKELTCRMVAAMNDLPFNFSTNQMGIEPKIKSNTEPSRTINKRKRSRNVLISSLNIKLSPEDLKKEVINEDELCSEEIFQKECSNSLSEKNNSSDDLNLKILELKRLCEKIEKEDKVVSPIKYKSMTLNTFKNNVDDNSNLQTKINNLENKDVPTLIESTLNNKSSNSKCKNLKDRNNGMCHKNYSVKSKNDPLSNEKANDSFEITDEFKKGILQDIKRILNFVQKEVNLFYQNNEYEPKSYMYFTKELLFDYKFYKDLKNEKLSKKQNRFENADQNPKESDRIKIAAGGDSDLYSCKLNNPGNIINENYEVLQHNYEINCENMQYFNVNYNSTNCDRVTSGNFENFCGQELISEEEGRMFVGNEIRSNEENSFYDLKNFECLEECLAYEEQLKGINKTPIYKPTFPATNSNIKSKNLPDDFNSDIGHNYNVDLACLQMISDCPTVVAPLNNFQNFSLNNNNQFHFSDKNFLNEIEKDEILESPSFSSASVEIDKNDLCMGPLKSCDNKSLKLDISKDNVISEMLVTTDATTKYHLLESNADQSTLCRQDSPNHFTIVLSPRKNSASVSCSVNMTIGGNTSTCSSSLTSPISIEVTREDIREKEILSIKTRHTGSKSSTEDLTDKCRMHRARMLDSKELERKRLRNLELYDIKKSEAKKPMGKQTRIIPIQPAESFEFTLSNPNSSVKKSRRPANHSVKSKKHDPQKVPTPYQIRYKNFKPDCDDDSSYQSSNISSVRELDIQQGKIPTNQILHKIYDSPRSPIYGTPVRRKILTASKAIRSPKYSLKTEPSPLKGTRHSKSSPHKIDVNNPKLYFMDESSSVHKREDKNRSQVPEKAKLFDEYQRVLNSPFEKYSQRLLCTKLSSPTELSSKFDHKFKRYARRGRNSGDLISYTRSTQWLRDAGIVGQVLTVEEADTAFKCAAGVKVALNKCDYRRFLIKLCRLKRLRYNEIYEKLTEAVNELA